MTTDPTLQSKPADTTPDNWVDAFAPDFSRPWLRLMRADRPIGTWLLLLPCLFGLALGVIHQPDKALTFASLVMVFLFSAGAFIMRGAGCAYNDIADRDFDAKVARTALRPIPAGQISVRGAVLFLGALCLLGLVILLQFNRATIYLGVSSLVLVAIYPFMKRITWWPQLWLGLTFNWGVLMGFCAVMGMVTWPAILLYAACIFWTLGYDTIYAHQDKEDDALIGVKSTARRLGAATGRWLIFFYGMVVLLFIIVFAISGFSILSWLGAIPIAVHFGWQITKLDINDPHKCLSLFKTNRNAAFLMLLPFIIELIIRLNNGQS